MSTISIALTKGHECIIDISDFELVSRFKWRASNSGKDFYAKGKIDKKTDVYMHRYILGATKGQMVDHINGNTLDNRRSNIRLSNKILNARNMKKSSKKGLSKYKGVSYSKSSKRWVAYICINNKKINLKPSATEIEAAQKYNDAALKFFGEHARLNDI